MVFLSIKFYLFVLMLVCGYYVMPMRHRWQVLLTGSVCFYVWLCRNAWWIFLVTILLVFGMSQGLYRYREKKSSRFSGALPLLCAGVTAVPWLLTKGQFSGLGLAAPLGISFYTLQMISYLVDIYRGDVERPLGFFQYVLYVSFFPQIVQGPIPRYRQLGFQLYEGHPFDERTFTKGIHLILWGFFLKMMIADKAAVIVDKIFGTSAAYEGAYILAAGILYSIQLYADFLACVSIAQGTAGLFGIRLADNFWHPYMAVSVQDFWRRWHISLSTWLRDYIYIPLGGNRKGKLRKYVNIAITFLVSGIWHGIGFRYLFWGMMHAVYQIAGGLTRPLREKIYDLLKMREGDLTRRILQRAGTFFWVMLAWIIFRADSLREGIHMIMSMFTTWNPWILFDDSLLNLGLNGKEWIVLILSVLLWIRVSMMQERFCIRDWILEQHVLFRWTVYIGVILVIFVCGTYGYGFNAQDFIYGGF